MPYAVAPITMEVGSRRLSRGGAVWMGRAVLGSGLGSAAGFASPGLTGFTQAPIVQVFPPIVRGGQVFLSWQSSAPAGTWYQVYIDDALAWHGQAQSTWLPIPSGPVHIDIGAVGAGFEQVDFSGVLAPGIKRRAELVWLGGSFEGSDIAGFQVFGSPDSGLPIDYATPLADITAYPAGITTDGFGLGRFGLGGFGSAPSAYSWISGPLCSGLYQFAVVPYDTAGNLGTAATTSLTISAPPNPPGLYADGVTRLTYSMIAGPEAVLTWNASPPC
jgi:hypothetical protein